ncbi:MAG: TonB family protein [Mucilaginibacter sp.]
MTGWNYLLLVNIYLVLFYGFYVLLLRKETFFQLNRIYLVSASLLSFFIPMIQSNWVKNLFITKEVQLTIYNSPLTVYQFKPIQHTQISIGQVLAIVYLAGMVVLIGRFIWQMIILNKIINQPEAAVPFSFFKKIKLGSKHEGNKVIAAHENVHARQWHSADVLLIEAVMIINWFNPIVYLYRFAIKHIHEYIADRQALKAGTNKSDYALLLLSQTFNTPAHHLVNPFYNHSLLKQRIKMLQKNKSHSMALVKYGLSVPLFILMLVLSSATVTNSETVGFVNKKVEQVLQIPATLPDIRLDSTTMVHDSVVQTKSFEKTNGKVNETPPEIEPMTTGVVNANPIFTSVEEVPQFPGGMEGFSTFLGKNTRYPANMRENGIQGRVIISFVVETDGSLSNVRVTRGIADELDKEALRVISSSPRWKPGIQNGRLVRVAYSVPINFALSTDDDEPVIRNPLSNENWTINKPDTTKKLADLGVDLTAGNPTYIVNGKEVADIKNINPANIESISVLKQASAVTLYGKKAKGGVVIVKTRSNNLKTPAFLSPAKETETKH